MLLNVLNINVPAVADALDCGETRKVMAAAEFQAKLAACRAQSSVDYAAVAVLKLDVLRSLFAAWQQTASPDGRSVDEFRRKRSEMLQRHCLFLVLREHFAPGDRGETDWHRWPEGYRDPASAAIAAFSAQHQREIEFLVWLQWIADMQLAATAAEAEARDMAVGLYRDLAVGADQAGSETWANGAAAVSGAQVGAPPDIHNPAGQNWGLPPFHPRALHEEAYESFIEWIRANMRHAGALRIDHVMGLQQLYWVSQGEMPSTGAYVRYPLDDLVGILALESHRQHCLVVGENLGTVPEGFRERMAAANILSYRVLYFEQNAQGGSLPPAAYPSLALAVVGSHDLPTLRGWWEGREIVLKERLGLYPRAGGSRAPERYTPAR